MLSQNFPVYMLLCTLFWALSIIIKQSCSFVQGFWPGNTMKREHSGSITAAIIRAGPLTLLLIITFLLIFIS